MTMEDKREEIIKRIFNPPKWSGWEDYEFVLCSECIHGCKRHEKGDKYDGCYRGTKESEDE